MKIKFANPRYQYDSYTDYRALVQLSGFEQCFFDEMRPGDDCVYIISPINGEYRPHIDNHRNEEKRNKLCVWVLERPCGESKNELQKVREFIEGNKKFLDDGYADELWLSDRAMAGAHNDARVVYMPMGSHPDLFPAPKAWEVWGGDKKWDYIYLSYLTHRRSMVLDRFRETHKMREKINCWGEERAIGLRYSKFMVNVHQDVHPMGEPLRFAMTAAAGIPLISEHIADPHPMIPNEHYVEGKWEDMVRVVAHAHKRDYRPYASMGKRLHDLLCNEHRFGKSIMEHCRNRQWIST
jgi:hypothetical protein